MIRIQVDDLNSQAVEAVLDNELYYIILDWNETGGYWEIGVRNSSYVTLADGICAVVNYPLFRAFQYPDMPPGDLQIVRTRYVNGPPPRDGFVTGVYQLIYATAEEALVYTNAV
jgi:hypothetical protein